MAYPQRSRGACWTCKVRKKKCDESHPSCLLCGTVGISCSGYGSKPDWMDGGAAQSSMAERFRQTVKQTGNRYRKKPATNNERLHTVERLIRSGLIPSSTPSTSLSPFGSVGSFQDSSVENVSVDESLRPQSSNESQWDVIPNKSDEDTSVLLMHYLDHVFPAQFPFYNPSTADGGRGWLLSILTRTKPLYHAALSISAYHHHSELYSIAMLGKSFDVDDCSKFGELQKQYVLALSGLREYLAALETQELMLSLSTRVAILACMALLISLEVFKEGGDNWQMHLEAASEIVPGIKTTSMSTKMESLSSADKSALYFFAGVLVWYDILSCATTGCKPFTGCGLQSSGDCYIALDKLMGCETWAMLNILEIAVLSEWKHRLVTNQALVESQLLTQAYEMEARLNEGIEKLYESGLTSPACGSPGQITSIVTLIFACSALVYLHVTVSGPHPELPEIKSAVSRTLAAFRDLPQLSLIRSLTWPLVIAGCMASAGVQQDSFRELTLGIDSVKVGFGNSRYASNIMEECWRMQKGSAYERTNATWKGAMKSLGLNILLV